MAHAHLKVVGVVGRGNFHCAGSKLFVHIFVGNNGNFPSHQRQNQLLAHQMGVSLILRVNGNRRVTQQGFGPGGGDLDISSAVFYGIFNVPEMACLLSIFYLSVRQGGDAPGAPVNNAVALVNQPLFVEGHKHLAHRFRQALVHRKAFPCPVAGTAQLFQLVNNPIAIELFPLPHLFHKLFAAQIVAGFAFFLAQYFLHLNLGGNAGVVGSGNPKGIKACHALVAD